jgi:hypothetical protein
MASRLPEFALWIQELGFDELIINPPWENLAEAENLIGSVKSAVVSDGSS